MKNKKLFIINIVILAILLIVLTLTWVYWENRKKTITAPFTCSDNKTITAVFYTGEDEHVVLKLSDGRTISLSRAIAASGARYANQDENIVFWNKGNTAFITESGQNTYDNCFVLGTEDQQIQSISDGNITMMYDQKTFGLAVTKEQLLVKSYIPACDDSFDYCFYYNQDTYKGTNFDSAGIRIKKRTDLKSSTCLITPPEGFDSQMQPDATKANSVYSSSVFSNVGQAAAGHYTSGALYRLYIKDVATCYEFETRIAESQFANYPEGTIKQFTDEDRQQVKTQLMNLLKGITLKDSQALQLP